MEAFKEYNGLEECRGFAGSEKFKEFKGSDKSEEFEDFERFHVSDISDITDLPCILFVIGYEEVFCFMLFLVRNFGNTVGTEELAHMEIVAAIIHQLTRNLTPEEIQDSGFGPYYIDHTTGIWPQAAGGIPFNACEFQSKGDTITDLFEDLAAEQKARSTYENILRVVKDPDVCDVIRYLRAREIVHFQRFGETLTKVQEKLNHKDFYAFNPSFDKRER